MTRMRRFFSFGNIRTQLLLCLALSMLSDALCNPLRLSVEWLKDEKLLSEPVADILWRVPPWLYVVIAVAFFINISRMSARLLRKLFPRVPVFGLWLWGALSFFSKGILPLLTASIYLAQRRRWTMATMAAVLSVSILLPVWKNVFWVLTSSLLIYVGNAVLFWKLPLSGRRPGRAILITMVIAGVVGLAALALNSAIASGGLAAFREMHEHFDKATRAEVEAREKGGISADLPLWRELAAAESDPYFKSLRTSEFRLPNRQACVAPEAANRELLKQLEPILKHRPAVLQYHYDREMDPEPPSDALPAIRLAANALARRSALAANRGDWKAAADDLAALEPLSELAGNSFGGMAYLSRLYCLWARQRAINGLLAEPKVPDEVLADWQRQLQAELEKQPEYFRKMLGDWYIESYEAITSDMIANSHSYNRSIIRLEFYLIFRSLRKAVYFDTLAEPEILKRLPACQEKRDKIPGILSRAKLLTFKWDYFQTALIRRSDLRSALAGIAIEQYRRKYGKRPDSLEALSPEFLKPDFFSPYYCPLKLEPADFEQKIDDLNYRLTGIRIVNPALKRDFNIIDRIETIK